MQVNVSETRGNYLPLKLPSLEMHSLMEHDDANFFFHSSSADEKRSCLSQNHFFLMNNFNETE